MDWNAIFIPSGSLIEVVVRGTILYLTLFLLLRVLPRRQVGSTAVSDLLLVVLIADAAQNGMAGEYRSVTEGIVLVMTIMGWDYAIDWVDHRVPALRLNRNQPLMVVRNGRIIRRNLDREHISNDELMAMLREQGVDSLTGVKEAYIEGNGRVSVIKRRA